MYLYDSIQQSTHIRNKNGKSFKCNSKKIIHHFKCNNCNNEFTRPKNGKKRDSDVHFCKDCPYYLLAQKESTKLLIENTKIRGKQDRGYKEVYVGENYPYRKTKWVREHIFVMETFIGSRIPKGMVVHHIDGDKQNNNIENLFLCNIADHNRCHAKIEKLVFDLYKKGKVGFDKDTLTYYEIV